MDPVLSSITREAVPKADYRVRRRKYGDERLLIRHTKYIRIDEVTDCVWLACERDCTVEQIINSVANTYQIPSDQAITATMLRLERLRALGFVTFDPNLSASD